MAAVTAGAPLTAGNARVKEARKLSRRSVRSERRLFLADGPKAVDGALDGRRAAWSRSSRRPPPPSSTPTSPAAAPRWTAGRRPGARLAQRQRHPGRAWSRLPLPRRPARPDVLDRRAAAGRDLRRRPRPRQRRHGDPHRRRGRRRRRRARRAAPSTPTTPRPCGPASAASSTSRSRSSPTPRPRSGPRRPPACTVLAADGAGEVDLVRRRRAAGPAHRLAVRQRGLGAARRARGAGRPPGPDPDPRPRREPQPRPPPPRSASTPPRAPSAADRRGLSSGPSRMPARAGARRPARRRRGRRRATAWSPWSTTAAGRLLGVHAERRRRPAAAPRCSRCRTRTAATGAPPTGPYDGLRHPHRRPRAVLAAARRHRGAGRRPDPPAGARTGRSTGSRSASARAAAGPASTGSAPTWSPPSPTSCARR